MQKTKGLSIQSKPGAFPAAAPPTGWENRDAGLPARRSTGWLLPAGLVVGLLLAWEWGVQAGWVPGLYFPAPSLIGRTLYKLLASGALAGHLGATVLRVGMGLLLGGVPGLALGMLMGWQPRLRTLVDPIVAALHPLPKVAVLPLFMVIFGINNTSLVVVAALGAFFPMLINTTAGVRSIQPIYFEVARNYGASTGRIFWRVVWPGSLAWVATGLRLALNACLLLTVAAEMVYARQGLGAMILMAWQTMRTEDLYVSLLVITLLGLLSSAGLLALVRYWAPWVEVGE